MRILDRYIVREVFRHAFLGLVVFTFVFFVPQLVRLMSLFVRHSGSGSQILKLFLCIFPGVFTFTIQSEEHTSELQSPDHLVCRLLLEKKKKYTAFTDIIDNTNKSAPTGILLAT